MSRLPEHLEPVPRDPKKLAMTAWILVAVMVIGGGAIFFSYRQWEKSQQADTRPAFVGRLTKDKDLQLVRQDASVAGIFDLNGKVSVLHTISLTQPETCALPIEVMQRLAKHYEGNPDFALVSVPIDNGPPETVVSSLARQADHMGARLPQWWVGATKPEVVHKYVKSELKTTLFPHREDTGAWVYDSSLFLVDRNRHVRRAVIPQKRGGPKYVATFDFNQAAEWDAKGIKTGTELTNFQELEALLIQTIDELLAESYQP